jgi:ribose 5-phosphate isomerase A
MTDPYRSKRDAGEAAALLVEPGMRVGLGTGSTVAFFLDALARRALPGLRCIATSPATARRGAELGLAVEGFDALDRLDITVDGADQVAPDGWLIKGGGGAHLREKIAAAAAERFVVIVGADKLADRLGPPVPLELYRYGLPATLAALGEGARVREGAPPSADGGVIADLREAFDDPAALSARLDACPGVAGHGLFAPELVHEVVVGEP